jgi:hypothetical protein
MKMQREKWETRPTNKQVEPLLERRKETFDHAQHKAKMLRHR